MEELNQKLEICNASSSKLISKHLKEMENKEDSEILYHKQAHEIYMYTFYKNLKFENFTEMKIESVEGFAFSPVEVPSFRLKDSCDENQYFDALLNAPIPFIFIPTANTPYSEVKNLCTGAFKFKENEHEGLLMDLSFACKVGIEFLACDFLLRKDVAFLYIGLLYNSVQLNNK